MRLVWLATAVAQACFVFSGYAAESSVRDSEGKKPPEPIAVALNEVLAGQRGLDQVRIDAEWLGRSMAVFGNGVGIWNQSRQFRVSRDELRTLLKVFKQHRFGGMVDGFLTRASAPVLFGGVKLTIGEFNKAESQLKQGVLVSAEPVGLLAQRLLNICEPLAQKGVTADSLNDALRKVAKGQLAPEALQIVLYRSDSQEGTNPAWLFAVDGLHAVWHRQTKQAIEDKGGTQITDKQLRSIVNALLKNNVADLPINLYSPYYTDLRVQALNYGASVQARKFANMSPTANEAKQAALDHIIGEIDSLRASVQARANDGVNKSRMN